MRKYRLPGKEEYLMTRNDLTENDPICFHPELTGIYESDELDNIFDNSCKGIKHFLEAVYDDVDEPILRRCWVSHLEIKNMIHGKLETVGNEMEKRVPGISRLIVKKIDEERKTTGGIIFADTFESTTQMCKILAVGECKGKYTVNHTAYIPRHTGIEIDVDDLVVLEGDILYSHE